MTKLLNTPAPEGDAMPVQHSRRSMALAMLGLAGGAAAFSGCSNSEAGGEAFDDPAPGAQQLAQALNGTSNIRWFDTIATMRAFSVGVSTTYTAIVHGFAAVGDGGGGVFVWSTVPAKDDAALDDAPSDQLSGVVVNPLVSSAINPNPAPGWRRLYSGAINVKWFGAVGAAPSPAPWQPPDNTAAIQAAILVAGRAPGGAVYLPQDTYWVGSNIRVRADGIRLFGDGPGASILRLRGTWNNPNPDVASIFSLASPLALGGASPAQAVNRIKDIVISDLGFMGDGNLAYPTVKAITSVGSENVTVQRCRFAEFGGEVIWPGGGSYEYNLGWNVSDNYFTNSTKVSRVPSTVSGNFQRSVVANNILENSSSAIALVGNDNVAQGNIIKNPYVCGIGVGEVAGSGQRNTVQGNLILIENGPVAVVGILVTDLSSYTNIAGNNIQLRNTGSGGPGNAHAILSYASGVHSISGNVVQLDQNGVGVGINGIRVEIASGRGDYVVSHNQIALLNESALATRAAITAVTWTDTAVLQILISGNLISGITPTNNGGDGFSIYCEEVPGPTHRLGTLLAHSLGNVVSDGRQKYATKLLNANYASPEKDTPVYLSTVGRVVVGNNLRGSVTASGGTGKTYTFALPTSQPDTSYFLSVTSTGHTPGATLGSNRVQAITKTTTSFAVTLEADPGAGQTVSFDWILVR